MNPNPNYLTSHAGTFIEGLPKRQKLIGLSSNLSPLCSLSRLINHDTPLLEITQPITDEEACIGFSTEHGLVYGQPRCALTLKSTYRHGRMCDAQTITVAGQSRYSRTVCLATHGCHRRRSC